MSKTININSVRLETALRKKFKTDRSKTISRALGFKDNALNEALKRGTVSNKMALALDKVGIDRREYEEIALSGALEPSFKDNADITSVYAASEPSQMSIDDLEVIRRSEIKEIVKDAVIDALRAFNTQEIRAAYDPIERTYNITFYLSRS